MGQSRTTHRRGRTLHTKMAVVDPAFQALLKDNSDKGGVEGLWRVQKLELVAVPKSQFGQFYEGDCYLLYDNKEGVEHVHFWIGNECSIDEQAVAAIKAVELDNLFGGLPIQHRETQGHESAQFKKYFEPGTVIKKGGMESGLQKAETNAHEAKLFKVAGGMRPVLTEVEISWSSMNHGDVFVLDSGKKIFVWAGANSSGGEKMTAGMVAAKMRDHPGESICHVDDGMRREMWMKSGRSTCLWMGRAQCWTRTWLLTTRSMQTWSERLSCTRLATHLVRWQLSW